MTSFAKYRKVSFLLDFAGKGGEKKKEEKKREREFVFITHFVHLESLTWFSKLLIAFQSKSKVQNISMLPRQIRGLQVK